MQSQDWNKKIAIIYFLNALKTLFNLKVHLLQIQACRQIRFKWTQETISKQLKRIKRCKLRIQLKPTGKVQGLIRISTMPSKKIQISCLSHHSITCLSAKIVTLRCVESRLTKVSRQRAKFKKTVCYRPHSLTSWPTFKNQLFNCQPNAIPRRHVLHQPSVIPRSGMHPKTQVKIPTTPMKILCICQIKTRIELSWTMRWWPQNNLGKPRN